MPNMHKLLLPSKKRKRLICILTSFAFHSFAHKCAFTPDLMAAADGAAAARLQLLYVDLSGFACVCVRASDVRGSEARKHHQPEPGFSHTVASTFCSASCVYTARCSAVRPRPMIWKSGAIEPHNMKFPNTGGMCLYSVFIKLWSTCLLKKKNTLCIFAALPVLDRVFF